MNFSKHGFTIDEFNALPVFEYVRDAPVGGPFLLQGRMSAQQDYLKELLVDPGLDKLKEEMAQRARNAGKNIDTRLKVQFWSKWKDGNVKECGGHIYFPEKLELKGDKVVLNFGDDSVKFEHGENKDGV